MKKAGASKTTYYSTYGRPTQKADLPKTAATGKTFLLYILVCEKPPAALGK